MIPYSKAYLNEKLVKTSSAVFVEGFGLPTDDVEVAKEVFHNLTGGSVDELKETAGGNWYIRAQVGLTTISGLAEEDPAYVIAYWAFIFSDRQLS